MNSPCGNCGTPLQWDQQHGAWFCPKEGTWAAQSPVVGAAQSPVAGAAQSPAPPPSVLPNLAKPKYVVGALVAAAAVIGLVIISGDPKESVVVPLDAAEVAEVDDTELQGLIEGPAIAPILTSNITFVAPKPGVAWAEMAFPCYRAAIELGDSGSVAEPFYQASPLIKPAFEAAGISIETDIAAIGGWDCGERPCIYIAARLREPKKVGDMLETFVSDIKQPEPLHWAFEAPGENGARTIEVRVIPIEWSGTLPTDQWSVEMASATHIIFVQGLFGGDGGDLQSGLATGAQAEDQVRNAEGVLSDTRGRCVLGSIGTTDFKPGFDLESSRFALGLPPASSDAIARMMGVGRSMNLEIEFALLAEASEADVTGWIDESRAWIDGVAAPVRAQFAGQGAVVQVMFDALEVIATQGFRHELKGKILRLSWHTDRISESSLVRMEAEMQRLQDESN